MVGPLLALAAVAVGAPVAVLLVVSLVIRREESAWSLGSPPAGPVQAAVRRILAVHTEGRPPLPTNQYRAQAEARARLQAGHQARVQARASSRASKARPAVRSGSERRMR